MKKQTTLTAEQQQQAEAAYRVLEPFMTCFSIRQVNHLLTEMFAAFATSENFTTDEVLHQQEKVGMYTSLCGMLNALVQVMPDDEIRSRT